MPDKKLIADRLRKLRGDRPREVVAIACGVSATAISNYENAIRVPSDVVKMSLAKYYGQSVEDIFFTDEVHEKGT